MTDNAPKPAQPWHATPAIRLSLLVHLAALIVLIVHSASWPWVIAALVANHLLLTAAVLWPRGRLLGPNLLRLPAAAARRGEVALTFDDGPDPEVTPQVLDLLDRYGAKASFFCVGEKAAAFPYLVREIIRRGHSVENHTQRHPHGFSFYGLWRLTREVDAAQAVLGDIAGRPPAFFRAPAGFRSPFLDPVLARRGLRYISWTRRGLDGIRCDPARVLRRLTRTLAAGDVLLLHDGAGVRSVTGEPVAVVVLPALLERLAAQGLHSVSLLAAFGLIDFAPAAAADEPAT